MTCFVLLAVGMLIQIIGFVGCCGAAKEASSMLCCYVLVQILITLTLVSEFFMVRRTLLGLQGYLKNLIYNVRNS